MRMKISDVENGLKSGIIRLELNPLTGSGTVCSVGNYWFYFGGIEAENKTPEEYIKNVPEEDIIREIYETIESFKGEYEEEYLYYVSWVCG